MYQQKRAAPLAYLQHMGGGTKGKGMENRRKVVHVAEWCMSPVVLQVAKRKSGWRWRQAPRAAGPKTLQPPSGALCQNFWRSARAGTPSLLPSRASSAVLHSDATATL